MRVIDLTSTVLLGVISTPLSAVINLRERAINLSHEKHRPRNLEILKNVSKDNNYPNSFFDTIIKKRIHQL